MLAFFAAFLLTTYAHANSTVIEGNQARFLYKFAEKMRFDDEAPARPDEAEFLGGCFFTRRNGGELTFLFCECPMGRITDPSELLEVVSPHVGLRPFPDLDDRENGTRGFAMRIEYSCTRRPVIFWHEYLCSVKAR